MSGANFEKNGAFSPILIKKAQFWGYGTQKLELKSQALELTDSIV